MIPNKPCSWRRHVRSVCVWPVEVARSISRDKRDRYSKETIGNGTFTVLIFNCCLAYSECCVRPSSIWYWSQPVSGLLAQARPRHFRATILHVSEVEVYDQHVDTRLFKLAKQHQLGPRCWVRCWVFGNRQQASPHEQGFSRYFQ